MRKQKRRLALRTETLATLGGLAAAALARVVGGGNGSAVCQGASRDDETALSTATGQSLSGSRKC